MVTDARTRVKRELPDPVVFPRRAFDPELLHPSSIVDLLSSDSDSDSSSSDDDSRTDSNAKKKRKVTDGGFDGVLPLGFLDPLPSKQTNGQLPLALPAPRGDAIVGVTAKQFWKAGDYESAPSGDWGSSNGEFSLSLLISCMLFFSLNFSVLFFVLDFFFRFFGGVVF